MLTEFCVFIWIFNGGPVSIKNSAATLRKLAGQNYI